FFDMDTNPAKWGFIRAGTAIFRHESVSQLGGPVFDSIAGIQAKPEEVLPRLAELHIEHGRNMLEVVGTPREYMLKGQFVHALSGRGGHTDNFSRGTKITWSIEDGQGIYAVESQGGAVYVGHAGRFDKATEGRIELSGPEFVALTITPLGGNHYTPLERRDAILVTACGRVENTGMQFSADRRTVGRNWGEAPVRIETVRGKVTLPEGRWTCHALAPDGSPKQQVPLAQEKGRPVLPLSGEYETMWYLLERNTR
ncbi:MAG: hypothetical protein JW741_15015, partial [Sedimentisphaerales bacterium]|nr:hypothetical protein [Sedimentisphaerales bacterium]